MNGVLNEYLVNSGSFIAAIYSECCAHLEKGARPGGGAAGDRDDHECCIMKLHVSPETSGITAGEYVAAIHRYTCAANPPCSVHPGQGDTFFGGFSGRLTQEAILGIGIRVFGW